MKRTLFTAATVFALTGTAFTAPAFASTDGFIIETTDHPHDEKTSHSTHSWIQQISDGDHVYELRMEDSEYVIIIDGDEVSSDMIKEKGDLVLVVDEDGEVVIDFDLSMKPGKMPGNVPSANFGQSNMPMTLSIRNDNGQAGGRVGGGFGANVFFDKQEEPRVMLGVYTGEPGESLREHLGLKTKAILVERVIKGLSADKAGIKDHDIIVSINGSEGISPDGLTKLLSKHDVGDELEIFVLRKGEKMKINTILKAYDAKALGHTSNNRSVWVTEGVPGQAPIVEGHPFFSQDVENKAHEKILEALRSQGISNNKIEEIQEQLRATLQEDVWSNLTRDGQSNVFRFRTDADNQFPAVIQRQELAQDLQKKAELAMREAERLTMEYKDGQLLLKRHAHDLEQKVADMTHQLHDAMPEIEEELDSRLEELEGRLDQLENMLESRMDSLTGLMERLMERLDQD